MSGGVDSAVALLEAGPEAVGVTLRLWLDPAGPDAERACCSPAAVIAAREACHARGLPHVTLDLREEFRAAVVEPFVARLRAAARRRTRASAATARFRFGELLAFADRIGAARLATGHYARIVERDGGLLLARAADAAKDQSYMLAEVDPGVLGRLWFPLGGQTKAETRAQAEAAGLAAAGRRREPGGVLPRRRRLPALPRAQRAGAPAGAGRRRDRTRGRDARRLLAVHDRPAARARRGRGGAGVRAFDRARARTPSSSARARRSRARASPSRAACTPARRASRRSCATGRPRSAATVEPTGAGFELSLEQPAYGVAPGQTAVLYADGAIVGSGLITSASAV